MKRQPEARMAAKAKDERGSGGLKQHREVELVFEENGPALEELVWQFLCRSAALWQEEWEREEGKR